MINDETPANEETFSSEDAAADDDDTVVSRSSPFVATSLLFIKPEKLGKIKFSSEREHMGKIYPRTI